MQELQEAWVRLLHGDDPLEKEITTRSSILVVVQKVKNLPAMRETRVWPWVGKIPWKREWQSTLVFLAGESLGRGGCLDTVHRVTKSQTWLKDFHFHFPVSCLENSKDRGAWWSTVHGVAKSRMQLSDWVCTHECTYDCIHLPLWPTSLYF